ncbi:death domain-associated protein 6 isoform X2 [Conger conger]|uniref:death domain-associated protein 6 isoform X2 n=1 Tax=Conger conger TaxID=82655 RepID=UPI002A5AC8CB|nr:death domain-associated protein 6 isoform X2 [Conger conger]
MNSICKVWQVLKKIGYRLSSAIKGNLGLPMDSIVIVDDDEEDPQPCSSTSSSCTPARKEPHRASMPAPTHITQSPFASSQKETRILLLENQRLFTEFLEHCAGHTQDCPEVMTFLQAKHAKASPDFLSSVEFRNTLGRCLTRAQSSRAKTFVFINELCTVLKQHAAKKRQPVITLPPQEPPPTPPPGDQGDRGPADTNQEPPSTAGQEERKAAKASRRQIAYLENLLKVYYDEIRRLQEKELSLEDMMQDDSGYIQEHKLKRKMMKIYDKLCELKGCSTLTGRVIEQRVSYSGTRYPEINKKIERFINGPEAQLNPPDYSDILRAVRRANERYALSLSRRQLTQIAQDAFRETGNRLQERRHLDMVFNFGSHLTDLYKPAGDPALTDSALARKLRSNREVALNSLEEVIGKYALKQDDTEEEERRKRLERDRTKKEALAAQKDGEMKKKTEEEEEEKEEKDEQAEKQEKEEQEEKQEKEEQEEKEEDDEEDEEEEEEEGGASEEEDEGDEEDEVSSDPDIEEELQASQLQEGADDDEEEEEEEEEDDPVESGLSCSDEEADENGEEGSQSASSSRAETATDKKEGPTPSSSPSQSGATASPDPDLVAGEPVSTNHVVAAQQTASEDARSTTQSPPPDWSDRVAPPPNGSLAPPSPVVTEVTDVTDVTQVTPNSKKRKRVNVASTGTAVNGRHKHSDSDSDIPLDMGVVTSSPLQADSTRADSPPQDPVSSSEYTPPPKKNKVNVSTQCDPDEVIILSDSD